MGGRKVKFIYAPYSQINIPRVSWQVVCKSLGSDTQAEESD